jgi:glycerophosphoryl diester phosphodiesterase/alpha-beta hydrolase superfamily lysophospholipase
MSTRTTPDVQHPGIDWLADVALPGYLMAHRPARVLTDPSLARRAAAGGRDDPILTLVRPMVSPEHPVGVVVHLHGYNDYFFHTHLAEAVMDAGWAFLAVDARRCGRSLRDDEVPHYQADLREQADDLDQAVAAAHDLYPGLPLVVHAHSTGGLVAALWAHAHRDAPEADALVLDSPFLAVERTWYAPLADPALPVLARQAPLRVISAAPSHYAQRLTARWQFDTRWKRPEGVPVRAGWLAAVRAGQHRLARGLMVPVPVLVAHSTRSGSDQPDGTDLDRVDTVLDVEQMADLAVKIGPDVTVVAVDGAVHDLALSLDEPRAVCLAELRRFLDAAPWASSGRPAEPTAGTPEAADLLGREVEQEIGPDGAPGTGSPQTGQGSDRLGVPDPQRPRANPMRWPGRVGPAVVAHRGSSWVAPQNTLMAFEAAARAGATAIELDLQRTADGVVVAIHDDTVDATTDGTGRVADLTLAELGQLDAGSWFGASYEGAAVPTWDQVVDLMDEYPEVGMLIELKDDWDVDGVEQVVAPLRTSGLAARSVLQTFSRSTVAALAKVAPDIPRGLLVVEASDDLVDFCHEHEAIACNPSGLLLLTDPGLVERLHAGGLQVIVWTLDEDWMWAQALTLGVDGIITDRPDRLCGWLAGRRDA